MPADRRGQVLVGWLGFLALAMVAGSTLAPSGASAQAESPELAALVKAAQAEGEMTFYCSATENVAKKIGDAFTAKYGIKTRFVRAAGQSLTGRYAAEAAAGNIAADAVLFVDSMGAFAAEGLQKGWIEDLWKTDLPMVKSGQFPAKFRVGPTAIVQISPWLIFYNSDKVKEADVPKDWPDLLDPKWKGQIMIPDPRASDAYLDFWDALIKKYGPDYLQKLRAQDIRVAGGGGPFTVQAVGAGEAIIGVPTVPTAVLATKAKGAPLGLSMPNYTTGVQIQLVLSARSKIAHPNAGALFANFVLSLEGNKILNEDPGSISVYDETGLPRDYVTPDPDSPKRKAEIYKALGL